MFGGGLISSAMNSGATNFSGGGLITSALCSGVPVKNDLKVYFRLYLASHFDFITKEFAYINGTSAAYTTVKAILVDENNSLVEILDFTQSSQFLVNLKLNAKYVIKFITIQTDTMDDEKWEKGITIYANEDYLQKFTSTSYRYDIRLNPFLVFDEFTNDNVYQIKSENADKIETGYTIYPGTQSKYELPTYSFDEVVQMEPTSYMYLAYDIKLENLVLTQYIGYLYEVAVYSQSSRQTKINLENYENSGYVGVSSSTTTYEPEMYAINSYSFANNNRYDYDFNKYQTTDVWLHQIDRYRNSNVKFETTENPFTLHFTSQRNEISEFYDSEQETFDRLYTNDMYVVPDENCLIGVYNERIITYWLSPEFWQPSVEGDKIPLTKMTRKQSETYVIPTGSGNEYKEYKSQIGRECTQEEIDSLLNDGWFFSETGVRCYATNLPTNCKNMSNSRYAINFKPPWIGGVSIINKNVDYTNVFSYPVGSGADQRQEILEQKVTLATPKYIYYNGFYEKTRTLEEALALPID